MNSLRWDIRMAKKIMREHKITENIQEFKKLLKCLGMAILITLAFFGAMSIIQAVANIPK